MKCKPIGWVVMDDMGVDKRTMRSNKTDAINVYTGIGRSYWRRTKRKYGARLVRVYVGETP